MANVPNGGSGKKPEYLERLKRQRRSSAVKFYITAIVLGGLCGLAYLERAEIKKAYDSLVSSSSPPPKSAPAPETKVSETKPPDEAPRKIPDEKSLEPAKPAAKAIVEPSVSPKDEAKARELLSDGKALLEKFDFAGAGKRFDEAAQLKLGAPLADEAKMWKSKAVEFGNATRHIAIADYAQGENAVIVETVDGTEWRGLKVREDDAHISLQVISETNPASEGKRTFPIPKTDIKRTVPLPLKQRQAEFAELLHSAESSIKVSHSTDYYDVVYLARRLGLGKECVAYLNRAYDGGAGHAPDPKIGDSFRSVVVRRVIGRATLLMLANRRMQAEVELRKLRETLPGYAAVEEEIATFRSQVANKLSADFQPAFVVKETRNEPPKPAPISSKPKSLPPREEAVEIGVSQLTSTGPAGQVLTRANTKFNDGMSIIGKYQAGIGGNTAQNNVILAQAKTLFDGAIDLYEEALKLEPSNKSIRDRQEAAGRMLYFCVKNTILGR